MLKPWLHIEWIFKMTPTGFRQRKVLKHLHGLTKKVGVSGSLKNCLNNVMKILIL